MELIRGGAKKEDKFLILIYIYLDTICEEIKEDIKNIEQVSKKLIVMLH